MHTLSMHQVDLTIGATGRRALLAFFTFAALLVAASGCRAEEPERVLAVGDTAPQLNAVAHDGTEIVLGGPLASPTVIYFYPKDGTPGCTREACAFRDVWDRYVEAGVRVVGVSADSLESHRAFAEEHSLPFPLVSDASFTWSTAFGVPRRLGMHARQTVLIAPDGTVAKIYPDVDPGTHADEVLGDALELLGAGQGSGAE